MKTSLCLMMSKTAVRVSPLSWILGSEFFCGILDPARNRQAGLARHHQASLARYHQTGLQASRSQQLAQVGPGHQWQSDPANRFQVSLMTARC